MRTQRVAYFIIKLYELLSNDNHKALLCWSVNGKSFKILDIVGFKTLLLSHFKSRNLGSFFRQLNLYNFYRISDGRRKEYKKVGYIHYYHEFFIKDHPHLLLKIRRKKIKSNNNNNGKEIDNENEQQEEENNNDSASIKLESPNSEVSIKSEGSDSLNQYLINDNNDTNFINQFSTNTYHVYLNTPSYYINPQQQEQGTTFYPDILYVNNYDYYSDTMYQHYNVNFENSNNSCFNYNDYLIHSTFNSNFFA